MKASEMIIELQKIIDEKGDQYMFFHGCGTHHILESRDMKVENLEVCDEGCCDIPNRVEFNHSLGWIDSVAEGVFIG